MTATPNHALAPYCAIRVTPPAVISILTRVAPQATVIETWIFGKIWNSFSLIYILFFHRAHYVPVETKHSHSFKAMPLCGVA